MNFMNLRYLLGFIFVILSTFPVRGQERLSIDAGTSYTTGVYVGSTIADGVYIFDKIPRIEKIINDILLEAGTSRNLFASYSGTVDSASAIIADSKKYIIYNQNFFDDLAMKCDDYFAILSVLAHEIGHHFHDHNLNEKDHFLQELEADRFAGVYLKRMGASLDEAKCALREYADDEKSDSHPAKSDRLAGLASGYAHARGPVEAPQVQPDRLEPPPSRPAPTRSELLAAHLARVSPLALQIFPITHFEKVACRPTSDGSFECDYRIRAGTGGPIKSVTNSFAYRNGTWSIQ